MKLVSEKQKRKTIIITVALAVVALVAVVGLIVGLISLSNSRNTTPKEPTIMALNIATNPKITYYVGEEFDASNILIQVVMSEQSATYFINAADPDLKFSGFDSSVPNESLPIKISYKGYTLEFNVTIKEKEATAPVIQSIRLSDDFQATYTLSQWNSEGPDFYGIKIICTYDDGSEKQIGFKYDYCYGLNLNLTSAGTTTFTIKYSESGVTVQTTVSVTITN